MNFDQGREVGHGREIIHGSLRVAGEKRVEIGKIENRKWEEKKESQHRECSMFGFVRVEAISTQASELDVVVEVMVEVELHVAQGRAGILQAA